MKKILSAIFAVICSGAACAANLDNPLPPQNVVATLSEDYTQVTLTWEFPGTVGEDGGYVDPNKVVYYIFDAFGSIYDPAIAVTSETSYTFDYSDISGQDFMAYQLTAGMDEIYYSLPVNSNIVCVGQPAPLPFTESFGGKKFSYIWAIDPESGYNVSYSIKTDSPQDGDGGYLFFSASKDDNEFGMISPKADIAQAENPTLSFFYKSSDAELRVMATTDGIEFAQVASIAAAASDWTEVTIPLTDCKGAEYVQIELWGVFPKKNATLCVDNITIADVTVGIPDVDIDADINANADYYTLDGRRVQGNLAPGIYIQHRGVHCTKILVK